VSACGSGAASRPSFIVAMQQRMMTSGSKEKEAVLRVFVAMFRPLMRIALHYGIGAGEIANAIKRTYVEELETRLAEQKLPLTDARIAITAGLARSDVSALREAVREGAPHSVDYGVGQERIGSVLTQWNSHQDFAGAYGTPMDLDLNPTPGSAKRSFKDLVEVACPGTDPDALLQALVAAGSVEVVDRLFVRHVSRAYLTPSPDVSRIEQIGRFSSAIASTFAYNLLRNESEPPYFERAVLADKSLSEQGRDAFLGIIGQKGKDLLEELDNAVAHLAESHGSAAGKRYGVGIYFFEDPASDQIGGRVEELSGNESPGKKVSGSVTAAAEPEEIDVLAMMSTSTHKK
jgi:uncharacterized protein DUF6502